MKLGRTDLVPNVTVRHFGGTDMINSVGPMCQGQGKTSSRFDRLHKLGGTDFGNKLTRELVRQTRWDRFAHLGETETLRRGNREFALQSRWDRSLILVGLKRYKGKQRDYNPISVRPRSLSVRLKRLGFLAVAMSSELGGAGQKISVGPSLTFGLGHMWI